jgi:tetratricopeptide (TPR) repeat protein
MRMAWAMSIIAVISSLSTGTRAQAAGASARGDTFSSSTDPDLVRAKQVLAQAKAAFSQGRFEEALRAFQQAYTLSGHPDMLYNIGLAADRLREDAVALDAFERYLRATSDTEGRAQVEQRVEALRVAQASEQGGSSTSAALSPAQVAAASGAVGESDAQLDTQGETDLIWESPWFWATAAVVGAGVVTALVVLGQEDDTTSEVRPGSGVVITTLGRSR